MIHKLFEDGDRAITTNNGLYRDSNFISLDFHGEFTEDEKINLGKEAREVFKLKQDKVYPIIHEDNNSLKTMSVPVMSEYYLQGHVVTSQGRFNPEEENFGFNRAIDLIENIF